MKILQKIGSLFSGAKSFTRSIRNSYDGGESNRLTADWNVSTNSADVEINRDYKTVSARALDLDRNNSWVSRYKSLLNNNVLGANGVGLQMKVKDANGQLDTLACRAIKDAWEDWKKRENCDIAGKHCWREKEGLFLDRTAIEGNAMIRFHRGAQFKYGFTTETVEFSRLDFSYSANLASGNRIRFGVESDKYGKVIAFHLFTTTPTDMFGGPQLQRERVDAKDIVHGFVADRPEQTIGMPWIVNVMRPLRDLGKYREAELVAARQEACKGYAIKPAMPTDYIGDSEDEEPLEEMSPGMGMMLKPGEDLIQINPTHPNTAFGEFTKSALREIASALNVGYMSLANDPSDANYSSMRGSKLEEIEEYKVIQGWLIESLHDRTFSAWLEMALSSAAVKMSNGSPLPLAKFDKFNAPDWKPRRWPWVDPKSDLDAAILSVEKGFKSRSEIIAEMGGDIANVFSEQESDNELAKLHKLSFPLGTNPQGQITNSSNEQSSTTKTV